MTITFGELPPIEERVLKHRYQMVDQQGPHQGSEFSLMQGTKNSFFAVTNPGTLTLGRPFEDVLEEPLDELLEELSARFPQINLYGYRPSEIDKFPLLLVGSSSSSYQIYQDPLSPEVYEKKMRRFRNSGLTYRVLGKEDIPKITELVTRWVQQKKEFASRKEFSIDVSNEKTISRAIANLTSLRNEMSFLAYAKRGEKEYEEWMNQKTARLYGAFKDGELVSYILTHGNSSFRSFASRAALRVNSRSPQEYLDLCVAKEFAEQGVEIFDRGIFRQRDGIIGLMEYKRKFGPVRVVHEVSYSNVQVLDDPVSRYLFGNFKIER